MKTTRLLSLSLLSVLTSMALAACSSTKENMPAPEDSTPKTVAPVPFKVFYHYEEQAQFPGGTGCLKSWISQNLQYPEAAKQNNIEGRVIVQFTIEEDGTVSSPRIARGVDKDLDNEAIRLVNLMPKWQPGKTYGVVVRSKYTLPIVFTLPKSTQP